MKKLLISDYDGTIKTINIRANIKAIKEFMAAGNVFTISTARSYKEIKNQLKFFHVPYDYLTCNSGAVTFDRAGHIIDLNAFSKLELRYIYNYFMENDDIYNNTIKVWYLDKYGNKSKDINNDVIANIEVVCNPLHDLRNDFNRIHGYNCEQYYGNVYTIKKHYVNKAYGAMRLLSFLRDKENITDIDVYSIGNTLDDLLLLKRYNGYRVANASSELKKQDLNEVSSVKTLINNI